MKSDRVNVLLDKSVVDRYGKQRLCSVQNVIPKPQVNVKGDLFSDKLISTTMSCVLAENVYEKFDKLIILPSALVSKEDVNLEEDGEEEKVEAPKKIDTSDGWQDEIPLLNPNESKIKEALFVNQQLKVLTQALGNANAVNTLFNHENGKQFCQKLLDLSIVETDTCGLNQLPVLERIFESLMSRWYSQRRNYLPWQ